jgi:hypothetical protein
MALNPEAERPLILATSILCAFAPPKEGDEYGDQVHAAFEIIRDEPFEVVVETALPSESSGREGSSRFTRSLDPGSGELPPELRPGDVQAHRTRVIPVQYLGRYIYDPVWT